MEITNLRINNVLAATIQVVGNKVNGDGVSYATELSDIEQSKEFLRNIIETTFHFEGSKHFTYIDSLDLNPVYQFVKKIFADSHSLLVQSNNLATYLYDQSLHPNIKQGEFYTLLCTCEYKGSTIDCVVLLKGERKDPFLTFDNNGKVINMMTHYGVGLKNIDKGCFIVNAEEESGYVVFTVDKSSNGIDARYWTDSFLHVDTRSDGYNKTAALSDLCAKYLRHIDVLSDSDTRAKAAAYVAQALASGKTVSADQMRSSICITDEEKECFDNIRSQYEEIDHNPKDEFVPVTKASKLRTTSKFTTLKLGNDFVVKVINPLADIERGYDDNKGQNYIKLFY